jgi:hypothetical protein
MSDEKTLEKDDKPQAIALEFVRTADFKMHFFNNIQISPGMGELQMIFGLVTIPPTGPRPEKIYVEQILGIAITIELAKRLLSLLAKQIELAEKARQFQESEPI